MNTNSYNDIPGVVNRYPGTTSFEDNETSRRLFFGREMEAKTLLHLILAEAVVILFSKSGYGKTSLLKTSIFHELRSRNYAPISVRFNVPDVSPIEAIRQAILSIQNHSVDGTTYEISSATFNNHFKSEIFPNVEIWSENDKLITPVLILDQFEEIFKFAHNEKEKAQFISELARLLEAQKDGDVRVKIVIAVREDYLGLLENLASEIPRIFQNRFQLGPLRVGKAKLAIVNPAQMDDPNISFGVPPFDYSRPALDEIVKFLRVKNDQGKELSDSDEVELIQLQILAAEFEKHVLLKHKKGLPKTINLDDIKKLGGLQKLISNFYSRILAEIKSNYKRKEYNAVRKVIEEQLIIGNNRVPMARLSILNRKNVNKHSLDELIERRLLKSYNSSSSDNELIEISHDSLIAPIQKSYLTRAESKKDQKVILIMISIALLVFGGIYTWNEYKNALIIKEQQNLFLNISSIAKRTNPSLGINIARYGYHLNPGNAQLDSATKSYRSFGLIEERIRPVFSSVLLVAELNDQLITVASNQIVILDRDRHFVREIPVRGEVIGARRIKDDILFVVRKPEVLSLQVRSENEEEMGIAEVRNLNNELIDTFRVTDGERATISPDGTCFVIDHEFFTHNQQTSKFTFDFWNSLKGMLQCKFSPDGQYIVSGHWTSDILIQDTSNQVVRVYRAGGENEKVEAVAISRKQAIIYSAKGDGEVQKSNLPPINEDSLSLARNYNFEKFADYRNALNLLELNEKTGDLLGVSVDGKAILWDSTGNRFSSLIGGHNSKITFADFVNDSIAVTGGIDGTVLFWNLKSNILVDSSRITPFSPFEYKAYNLDLPNYTFENLYHVSKPVTFSYIQSVIDYSSSLPYQNEFPEDPAYCSTLEQSFEEVSNLYHQALQNPLFDSLIPVERKWICKATISFMNKWLIINQDDLPDSTRYVKYEELLEYQLKTFNIDSSFNSGIEGVFNLSQLVRYNIEKVNNFQKAVDFQDMKIKLYEDLIQKHQVPTVELATELGNYSWYQIFNGQFEEAITSIHRAFEVGGTDNEDLQWVYTNLPLAYLLAGQYDTARQEYEKLVDKHYTVNAVTISYRSQFLEDIKALEKKGLTDSYRKETVADIHKIKNWLISLN